MELTLRQAGRRWATYEIGVGGSGSFNTCILTFTKASLTSSVIVESDFTAYSAKWLNSKLGRYSNQGVQVMYHAADGASTTIAWTQGGTGDVDQTITISLTGTCQHPVANFKIICGGLDNQVTNVAAAWSNV